jgi:flagellum-specific peptidoglycan hydrolase FlgJ
MVQTLRERNLDGLNRARRQRIAFFDLPLARFVQKNKRNSVLFSRYGKTNDFLTSDSKLYLTQNELARTRKGEKILRTQRIVDSAVSRHFHSINFIQADLVCSKKEYLDFEYIKERYIDPVNFVKDFFRNSVQGVSTVRMWNVSLVSSLIFGMFLMTMMYRYLGQGASAREKVAKAEVPQAQVLSAEDEKRNKEIEDQVAQQILEEHAKIRAEAEKNSFEGKIREMTKGYPIEKMAPDIARQDKIVAAFMIGIAKKESDWGKRVPVLDGKDCYNYWGFRAQREKMGTGGHTCFDSRSDAVASVAKRIKNIIEKENIKTPKGMVTVWKCGYDCSWDSAAAVKKWVSDVDGYFDEVDGFKK